MKNHQRYQVTYELQPSGQILFLVDDPRGNMIAINTVFFSNFTTTQLASLKTMKQNERDKFILAQLEKAFKNPYQVTVEPNRKTPFIRIGDVGLLGGVNNKNDSADKEENASQDNKEEGVAVALVATQIFAGVGLLCSGGGILAGETLLSSGLGGVTYFIKADNQGKNFSWKSFLTHSAS